jgi:hypothetical protein
MRVRVSVPCSVMVERDLWTCDGCFDRAGASQPMTHAGMHVESGPLDWRVFGDRLAVELPGKRAWLDLCSRCSIQVEEFIRGSNCGKGVTS